MKPILHWIAAWIIAALVTFALASVFHSQFVLYELSRLNIAIPSSEWVSMTLSDFIGLLPSYGGAIAFALLMGFIILTGVNRYVGQVPRWLFPFAAAFAMAVMLLAMQPILNVTLIAGARSTLGFLFQCAAGLMGGYVFARIISQKHTSVSM
ncbi:hypothetical protein [Alteromonas oceanisediminis]|uniref:hypothetical protein n=1 Tax=Alteromonas oceanisediminis TaxID=2836180 RepID=UPI001BDAA7E6|nr:hypothetical protein [Alteromonas oceanisediminis]MBT0585273.1 hypothetical protein [Alteromonas oceanisediminis]